MMDAEFRAMLNLEAEDGFVYPTLDDYQRAIDAVHAQKAAVLDAERVAAEREWQERQRHGLPSVVSVNQTGGTTTRVVYTDGAWRVV